MGHDIIAKNKQGKEIAYARYSAFHPYTDKIYEVLGAIEFNAGVSGIGLEREYSLSEIREAKQKCDLLNESDFDGNQDELTYLKNFIYSCFNAVKKDGCITICFY